MINISIISEENKTIVAQSLTYLSKTTFSENNITQLASDNYLIKISTNISKTNLDSFFNGFNLSWQNEIGWIIIIGLLFFTILGFLRVSKKL